MNYKKEVLTKIKTIMKLTREDFEGLEVGIEILYGLNSYKFNHIVNDLVFMTNNVSKIGAAFSIDYLNDNYAIIQKPKQYYKGWEIGDYTGKNVWVKVSDKSEMEATGKKVAFLLK